MRILYDAPFHPSPKSGVARYFHEISRTISSKNNIWFSRCASLSSCNQSHVQVPPIPHFRPHRLSFFLEMVYFSLRTRRKPFEIVHAGEYAFTPAGSQAISRGAVKIITVHDLIHEKFGAPGSLYVPEHRKAFYRSANGLIFVSESTRNDFFEHYKLPANSIPHAVVHHGMTFQPRPPNPEARNSNQFLFVGSRSGYKNSPRALEAFRLHWTNNPGAHLIIAGSAPTVEELRLSKPIEKQITWLQHPDDEQLMEAYRTSVALLYVSEYEGFGLPLLEAMSQGCVPIAGNHSSIPEVMGDGGCLINDTSSPPEIAKAMNALVEDESLRAARIAAGLKRCRAFTWQQAAEQTLSLYEEALAFQTHPRAAS